MIQGAITGVQEKFLLLKYTLNFQEAMDGLKSDLNDLTYHTEIEQVKKLH